MRLIIVRDIYDESTATSCRVADGMEALRIIRGSFPVAPENARFYLDMPSEETDISPHGPFDMESIRRISTLTEGVLTYAVYPAGGWVAGLVTIVVAVVASFFFSPKPKASNLSSRQQKNTRQASPNNGFSERQNEARVNCRVPDIFGTVRSTPDLIAPVYSEFKDNVEVENVLAVIGCGQYEIHDMRDDTTAVSDIGGATVEVYKPGVNVSTGEPYYRVGNAISSAPMMAQASNAVDGQTLKAPNQGYYKGNSDIRMVWPNIIRAKDDSQVDFTGLFEIGDRIKITRTNGTAVTRDMVVCPYDSSRVFVSGSLVIGGSIFYPGSDAQYVEIPASQGSFVLQDQDGAAVTLDFSGKYTISRFDSALTLYGNEGYLYKLSKPWNVNSSWNKLDDYSITANTPKNVGVSFSNSPLFNFNGSYTVLSVSFHEMTVQDPSSVSDSWNDIKNSNSPWYSAILRRNKQTYIGYFNLEQKERTHVWANFQAINGLYKDDGHDQVATSVEVAIDVQQVDANGKPTGSVETFTATLKGSATDKSTKSLTLKAKTSFTGPCRVRCYRTSDTDLDYSGSVVDEVKIRDCYAMASLPKKTFPGVTVLRALTTATTGALSIKDRKINCLVTRQLPRRTSGSSFTTELYSTRDFAPILSFIAMDPLNGNMDKSEIDFDSIYNASSAVRGYFGTPLAAEFSYTIDDEDLSFEEIANMVCEAAFCTPYRRGQVLKVFFEKETSASTLLFNHRNKKPGSETRTITFGYSNDNDGVEYEYVSPEDDAIVTLYIPENKSAVKPLKVESKGVRSKVQAHLRAWRIRNKQLYQHISTEFDAMPEASLLMLNDRILNADNTRQPQGVSQEGDIRRMQGLTAYTSQRVTFKEGKTYTAFLQLSDGTVQNINVTKGPKDYSFILSKAPRLPLVYGDNLSTTYLLAEGSVDDSALAFLVEERTENDDRTVNLKAINYDARYYANDKDYINGVVSS